jgi:thiol:disulfide interchange protein DsbD
MQTRCIKNFLFFILVFAACCKKVSAQSNPVHFSFSAERNNDSLVSFIIKAKNDTGFFLFSAKPQNTDDAFVSQLNLDSASAKLLADTSIAESLNITTVNDEKTRSSFRGFTDSATFIYPFKIKKQDSAIIKGSFAWLGKMNDEFPSGEENFEITVPPEKAAISGVAVSDAKPKSWLGFFWIGLVAGLIAVFLPCLYPLFPVTVTYFMHQYGSRKQ